MDLIFLSFLNSELCLVSLCIFQSRMFGIGNRI